MSASQDCPDLERLAAFLDRRLDGAEDARVKDHLAACEPCYEVFAESLRFMEEESLSAIPPRPGSARTWWTLGSTAAAAVFALVVLLPLLLPPRTPPFEHVLLPLAGKAPTEALGPAWDVHGWAVTRGSVVRTDERRASFRLAVLTVDLRVALAGRDAELSRELVQRLLAELDTLELAQPLSHAYTLMRQEIEGGTPHAELVDLADETQDLVREWADPPSFAFGRWCEESRLAALAQSGEYFRDPGVLGFVEAEVWRQQGSAEVLAALHELRSSLDDPDTLDYRGLAETFSKLIAQSG